MDACTFGIQFVQLTCAEVIIVTVDKKVIMYMAEEIIVKFRWFIFELRTVYESTVG